MRAVHLFMAIAIGTASLGGCGKPRYDASSPQAALDSMYKMIADGHPEMLGGMIHIQSRDVTFADGVTEASAIQNVIDKTGDMLGQLYRVASKVRARFPAETEKELNAAGAATDRGGLENIGRFLADPFGLMDQQRQRISVEDLGDGTAAILIDGQPAFGLGLMMREVDGVWKVDVPINLMQRVLLVFLAS